MIPIKLDGVVVGEVIEVSKDGRGVIVLMELYDEQNMQDVIADMQPISFKFRIKPKGDDVPI